MDVDVPQRLNWMETELYKALSQSFPEYRTRQQKVLDVEALAKAIGMTEEGVYKWLRAGRILSTKGVQRLFDLANTAENTAALQRRGRKPPTRQELAGLMLA